MVLVNFSLWEKNDPTNSYLIETNKITWSKVPRNSNYGVYNIFTVDSLNEFEHKFEVCISELYTDNDDSLLIMRFWECRNKDNTKMFLYAQQRGRNVDDWKLVFAQNQEGEKIWSYELNYLFNNNIPYYVTISRKNKMAYLDVFLDEQRTQIAEHYEKELQVYENYKEIYMATLGMGNKGPNDWSSGYIKNFEIDYVPKKLQVKKRLSNEDKRIINNTKIKRIEIERFKTIINTQKLDVDSHITTLIGPNESGKTNLLQAINCFNITENFKEEDISRSDVSYDSKTFPKLSIFFEFVNKDILSKIFNINEIYDELKIEKQNNGIENYKIYTINDKNELNLDVDDDLKKEFLESLPKIVYYKDITVVPDNIQIDELLNKNTSKSVIFKNLLLIGGINEYSFLNENKRRLDTVLRKASNKITEEIKKLWNQENFIIQLTKEGDLLSVSIEEDISVKSSPNERSEGFQWFLAFITNFMESTSSKKKYLFLLDEPALKLHPNGQKDFKRILEFIANNNQIIYTSHSPFLINRNFPQRIRMLKKNESTGTIVNNKPYSDGKCKFWEPLKSSIGICLGDMLSIGEKNLIVEGVSDQIYLSGLSYQLSQLNLPSLDLENVSIVPSMGAESAIFYGQLASSNGLKSIILLDYDKAANNAIKKAKENNYDLNIIQVNKFNKNAKTIEDLLPVELYINTVNEYYKKYDWFKEISMPEKGTDVAILDIIKEHFSENDLDKVAMASHIINNLELNHENEKDFKAFQKMFEIINEN